MDKQDKIRQEVVKNLKGHLKGKLRKNGHIGKPEYNFCIKNIMDFMPYLSKKEAVDIYRNEILSGESFESGVWDGVEYSYDDDCVTVFASDDGALNIKLSNIPTFSEELQKICRAFGG